MRAASLFPNKHFYKQQACNKTTDVCRIGNSSSRLFATEDAHTIDDLENKPDTYCKKRRYCYDEKENPDMYGTCRMLQHVSTQYS